MSDLRRIAITGMSINTPLGDTLEGYLESLLQGRSAVTRWRSMDASNIYAKIGADLGDYDLKGAVNDMEGRLPDEVYRRLRRLSIRAPWSTRMSMLTAARCAVDANFWDRGRPDEFRVSSIVSGHNINAKYIHDNSLEFMEEPDFIDNLMSLHSLDTDHAGSVSELLRTRGPIYTVGGACASGNLAIRSAVDEIRFHGMEAAFVVGAAVDFSPVDLHAMALMGAITHESFNDAPEKASRPYDVRREGFVPSHGAGALLLEEWEHARARGARIYAEIMGVEANADANHLPEPSEEGQTRLMRHVLKTCNVAPERIDYINAHATSTQLGDRVEIRSIKNTFGDHARELKINAPKSMLGHVTWAAPMVETVAAVLQMRAGRLHPSINIEKIEPEIDLDVCRDGAVDHEVRYLLKNAFGFGGINCVSILRKPEKEEM
ncbi:MAG: beta-ketoacyl-[acyl-carrier-protein] synthase family protein [Desulfobacterales bacterium]|nr:beta-ketoacyl-[acyl-carrier-protein] synthase family protein [Desulfobacterales bacterium]